MIEFAKRQFNLSGSPRRPDAARDSEAVGARLVLTPAATVPAAWPTGLLPMAPEFCANVPAFGGAEQANGRG